MLQERIPRACAAALQCADEKRCRDACRPAGGLGNGWGVLRSVGRSQRVPARRLTFGHWQRQPSPSLLPPRAGTSVAAERQVGIRRPVCASVLVVRVEGRASGLVGRGQGGALRTQARSRQDRRHCGALLSGRERAAACAFWSLRQGTVHPRVPRLACWTLGVCGPCGGKSSRGRRQRGRGMERGFLRLWRSGAPRRTRHAPQPSNPVRVAGCARWPWEGGFPKRPALAGVGGEPEAPWSGGRPSHVIV